MVKLRVSALFMAFLMAGPLAAHEFWLEAEDYTVEAGEPVNVQLRVGQDFGGSEYPFVQQRFKAFTVTTTGKTANYKGRAGDRPAYQDASPKAGLQVLSYESQPDTLRFTKSKPDLLERYLIAEGLDFVLEKHRADGLPEIGISEIYSRNAKALVQVGPSKGGKDKATGLPFELVVQGTPYDGDTSVTVQLLWRGKAMPNYPINVFTKAGDVVQTRVQTDGSGMATVAFPKGSRVLMNSVQIKRRPDGDKHFYESWWASTTFGW
jgi:uncharacterized GH25 family protein